jgi:muconolactone D-isomerase
VLEDERRVGLSYRRKGAIQRIWRVPGSTANVGVWNASDASELHTLLSDLPAFSYMRIQVEALALHYLESVRE